MTRHFRFEPVENAHLPMVSKWLESPRVREWWGDPVKELELIRTARSSGEADGYIVYLDDDPVGYIQSWYLDKVSDLDEEPWLKEQPAGTIGIDIFVGEQAATGKGIGADMLRQFCEKLIANGARRIIIDPDPANMRAVHAYRKAGFSEIAVYKNAAGSALLMELEI